MHERLGVPAQLATPSAVTALDARLRLPRTVMIAISQSGSSPDIVATVDEARESGAVVIALTNDELSPLALRADAHVPLSAGDERAVAATKTYTAEIAALHQIIGGAAGVPWSARTDLLRRAADAVELHLELHDDGLDAAADLIAGAGRLVSVGRGLSMSSAREAALELHGDLRNPGLGLERSRRDPRPARPDHAGRAGPGIHGESGRPRVGGRLRERCSRSWAGCPSPSGRAWKVSRFA